MPLCQLLCPHSLFESQQFLAYSKKAVHILCPQLTAKGSSPETHGPSPHPPKIISFLYFNIILTYMPGSSHFSLRPQVFVPRPKCSSFVQCVLHDPTHLPPLTVHLPPALSTDISVPNTPLSTPLSNALTVWSF